jgi:hydrogenase maturation factor HypE
LLESVRLGYSLSVGDAISSAIGMLGFGRSTQKIAATVEDSLSALIQSGALERAGGVITLSVGPS